jgi:hypothetical protein
MLLALLAALLVAAGCKNLWPDWEDRHEADAILQALVERYRFPVQSKVVPTQPGVLVHGRPGANVITVYGVTDRAEQDEVIAILRELRHTVATKPIFVDFYREEVLERYGDPAAGHSGWQRESRGKLRTERIR